MFKQRMKLTLQDREVIDKAKQAVRIKIAVGNIGLKKINNSGVGEAEQKEPKNLWKIFEEQLKIHVNFRVHRLELMKYKLTKRK